MAQNQGFIGTPRYDTPKYPPKWLFFAEMIPKQRFSTARSPPTVLVAGFM
jgi:hypothetical protein